jgi:hypothetical protein
LRKNKKEGEEGEDEEKKQFMLKYQKIKNK